MFKDPPTPVPPYDFVPLAFLQKSASIFPFDFCFMSYMTRVACFLVLRSVQLSFFHWIISLASMVE